MKKRPMEERTISSQAEYDALPKNYKGRIIIRGEARIETRGSADVVVFDSATVIVHKNSAVVAHLKSTVIAYDSAIVRAYGASTVTAYESSNITAYDASVVTAFSHSNVEAYNLSIVRAFDSSVITAYDLSTVMAYELSRVAAYGSSQVIALNRCDTVYHSSAFSVQGLMRSPTDPNIPLGFLQDSAADANITLGKYARKVALPANIEEYSDWYNVPIIDGKVKLYKAVHRDENGYYSDYDPDCRYVIGEEYETDCDKDTDKECSYGLHVAYLNWAVNYCDWQNGAILEVEVPIDCIVVPHNTDGKIRTSKLKVLREVPRKGWR